MNVEFTVLVISFLIAFTGWMFFLFRWKHQVNRNESLLNENVRLWDLNQQLIKEKADAKD